MKGAKADLIIFPGLFIRCDLILSNITANDQGSVFVAHSPASQSVGYLFYAIIIKTHSIDQRLVGRKAEQPGFGVSFLGQRCYGANFHMSKTQAIQLPQVSGIFIKTSGKADHMLK